MEFQPAVRSAGTVLAVTGVLLPPLAVFAPLGAAPILGVAAIAMIILDWRRCRAQFGASAGLAMLLGGLGLWASASFLWSIIPNHSLFEGLRFLVVCAGGLTLLAGGLSVTKHERRRIDKALLIGLGLALFLLAIERFTHQPITRWWHHITDNYLPLARFDRGVIVVVLSGWAAICAKEGSWPRLALILVFLATTLLMVSEAAMLAALAGTATFIVARFAPRLASAAMIAGTLVLGIAIPIATPGFDTVLALHDNLHAIKPSGIHRLLIWRFAADHAAERPFLGWGMDASRAIPGGQTDLNVMLPGLHYGEPAQALPLHPHDAALQWQLELGIPGLALGLAIVIWIIYRVGWEKRLSPTRRAGALALTMAALTIGLLSFGVWQAWWLSTLWLSAGLFAATASGGADDETLTPDDPAS